MRQGRVGISPFTRRSILIASNMPIRIGKHALSVDLAQIDDLLVAHVADHNPSPTPSARAPAILPPTMSKSEGCCEDALMGPIISLAKFRPQGPDPERGAFAARPVRATQPRIELIRVRGLCVRFCRGRLARNKGSTDERIDRLSVADDHHGATLLVWYSFVGSMPSVR